MGCGVSPDEQQVLALRSVLISLVPGRCRCLRLAMRCREEPQLPPSPEQLGQGEAQPAELPEPRHRQGNSISLCTSSMPSSVDAPKTTTPPPAAPSVPVTPRSHHSAPRGCCSRWHSHGPAKTAGQPSALRAQPAGAWCCRNTRQPAWSPSRRGPLCAHLQLWILLLRAPARTSLLCWLWQRSQDRFKAARYPPTITQGLALTSPVEPLFAGHLTVPLPRVGTATCPDSVTAALCQDTRLGSELYMSKSSGNELPPCRI